MFPHANIAIGNEELEWSLKEPWGTTVLPELYVKELKTWPTLKTIGDGDDVFPGITAHLSAGHTPGSLVFVLDTGEIDLVFSGDACKNPAKLLLKAADMTFDVGLTRATIEPIWASWSKKPNSILVPGHYFPMVLDQGEPRYLCEREARIRAWYREDLDETTVISLIPNTTAGAKSAAE